MIDFIKYTEFVNEVTSDESKEFSNFVARLFEIAESGVEISGERFDINRLLTAAVGMSAEAGEFTEVVKKIIFQGKPLNEDNIFHMKRELGDIMWYVAQATMALGISMEEVLDRNITKLGKRYPEGAFDAYYSENRAADDR